jgi:hypothetical protein
MYLATVKAVETIALFGVHGLWISRLYEKRGYGTNDSQTGLANASQL